jgi:peptide/nickel transport system permease protein
MWKYVLKRILWMVVIMLAVTVVIFTITYFIPGDPARTIMGSTATETEVAAKRAQMGLDKPFLVQMGNYFSSVYLHGDFGTSWSSNSPVLDTILSRLPITILIGGVGMIIQVLIGVPLGVMAAVNQGKWQDYLSISLSMILISLPDFWVALMLVIIFAVKLGWVPVSGITSWKCFILPIIVTAIGGIANNARQTRSSMLEVFRADFITTARAKGQKENVVIWKHMFPNALMPIITMVIGGLGRIVGGSSIVESIFAIPGIGLYLLTGINNRDYPVIRGATVVLSLFSAAAVLLMDLCYAFVDPRIKAQYSGKKG